MSSLFCALLQKVLFISQRRTYILVLVFHSLSRCLFSLEFLFLGRLGVVPSVLEFLLEALLDDYVLELGHRPLHTVVGFQFNRYHVLFLVCCVSLSPTPVLYHVSRALSSALPR